jgi:hypothetical protein
VVTLQALSCWSDLFSMLSTRQILKQDPGRFHLCPDPAAARQAGSATTEHRTGFNKRAPAAGFADVGSLNIGRVTIVAA